LHIANSHALQVHRLAGTNPVSVVKISGERDFLGKKATRPAYEKDENSQGDGTGDYGYPDL
jgi:hypothetical protein